MKKILFLAVMAVGALGLLAQTVKAETLTCPVGYSVQSVLVSEAVPAVPGVNWHRDCTFSWHGMCLGWTPYHWEVEPVAEVPAVYEDQCVRGDEPGKPSCPSNAFNEYTWDEASFSWKGQCKNKGGASDVQTAPQIAQGSVRVNGRVVSFLASDFSTGGVLLRPDSETVDTFAIDSYSHQHTWYLPKFVGNLAGMDYYGADNDYGYKWNIKDNSLATFHQIIIPKYVPNGEYFMRIYFNKPNSNATVFSMEQKVVIY
ncbi:MAG: hypothetical protein WC389_20970 [Lutibacter sp.]|jgi:hypothetical protein